MFHQILIAIRNAILSNHFHMGLQSTRLFSNVMHLSTIALILLSIDNSMATVPSSALVLYTTDTAPLARFRETTRRVTVGSDPQVTVTLEQSWDEYGVAGVLWDSVSTVALSTTD